MAIHVAAPFRALSTAGVRRHRLAREEAVFGYALLLPGAILMIVLVGLPFLRALWLSFHRKLLGSEDAPWIGLQNYASVLASETFWTAVANTFIFTIGSIGTKLLLGLVVALIINETMPLRGLWRS